MAGLGRSELAETIVSMCGTRSRIVYRPLSQDDPRQRYPDITPVREKLAWEPKVPLYDGLNETIDYFRHLAN